MKRILFLGLALTLCCNYALSEEAINSDITELRPKAEVEVKESPKTETNENNKVEVKETSKTEVEQNSATKTENNIKVEVEETSKTETDENNKSETSEKENENDIVPLKLDAEMPVIHDDEGKERSKDIKTYVVPEKFDAAPIKKDNTPMLKPLILNAEDGNIREEVPVGVEHKNILKTGTDPNGYTDITSEEKEKAQEPENPKEDKPVNFETNNSANTAEEKEVGAIYLDFSNIKKNKDSLNNLKQPPVKLIKDDDMQIQDSQPIPSSIKVF